MKRLALIPFVLAVFCFMLLASMPSFAQDWSAAQKEVWKNVEAYWAFDAAGDVEGFTTYLHADYLGWSFREPLPRDKASMRKWLEYYYKTGKTIVQDVKPVGIKIHGNIAIVHYYYSVIIKDADGKDKNESGRWTDILMKQGDKWLLIADHGGQTSKD